MHDMSAPAAHHHAPPTSFIRKHVFSLDHKVIGKQYYALALVAALCGMVLTWVGRMRRSPASNCSPRMELLAA